MIKIKSAREIALLKEAGTIVAKTHIELIKHIKPGVSTKELDRIAEETIRSYDAIPSFKGYGGFPASICASVNEVVVHGIPSENKILKNGDIISIDIGAQYKGYHGDSAWTYPVGEISESNRLLLEVTKASLFAGLDKAKPGNHLYDISRAISSYVKPFGYGIVEDYTGHGIGSQLHEDPAIPNYEVLGSGPLLKPGMVLAIEPMINKGRKQIKVLLDNWTAVTVDKENSAHYEHTIAITEDGYEILTVVKQEDN